MDIMGITIHSTPMDITPGTGVDTGAVIPTGVAHTGPDTTTAFTMVTITEAVIIMDLPTVTAGWITGTITDIQGRPMLPQGVPRVPQPVIPGTGAVPQPPQIGVSCEALLLPRLSGRCAATQPLRPSGR